MVRRFTTSLLVALMVLAMTASSALADEMSFYKSSGRAAQTSWIQVDGIDPGTSPLGNVHVGELFVFEVANGKGDVFAYIEDWDCEPGSLPDGGGHFALDEEPSGCSFVGDRYGEGFGLSFSVDRKLKSANLSGQLTIYGGGHGDGGVIGTPMANITWTGVGDLIKQSSTWRYSEGSVAYTDRYRSTDRQAEMSGTLGPMGFDPELSGGFISSFRSMSKSRSR